MRPTRRSIALGLAALPVTGSVAGPALNHRGGGSGVCPKSADMDIGTGASDPFDQSPADTASMAVYHRYNRISVFHQITSIL